jgi:hypothetical protein
MSCWRIKGNYRRRYLATLWKVTSLVLAFSFAVSSPLSLAVAYAQTISPSDASRVDAPQSDTTTTDQGTTSNAPRDTDLNFTVTGESGTSVTAPSDTGGPADPSSAPTTPSPSDAPQTTDQASTDPTSKTSTSPDKTKIQPLSTTSGGPEVTKRPSDTHKRTKHEHEARPHCQLAGYRGR